MDVARGELVEKELDAMIERRASKEPDLDEREEIYAESVRRYGARRSEEVRAARVEYHRGQAARLRAVLGALVEEHETQAERLCEEGDAA